MLAEGRAAAKFRTLLAGLGGGFCLNSRKPPRMLENILAGVIWHETSE